MSIKTFFTFAVGFGAGWAVRSMADSPHGVGVKLAEVGHRVGRHVKQWKAIERERIVDILAEGRAKAEQGIKFGRKKVTPQEQKAAA